MVTILMMPVEMAILGSLEVKVFWKKLMTSSFLSMTYPTQLFRVTNVILWKWSCGQNLLTLAFVWETLSQLQSYKDLTKKATFFEGWSWFCFNSLRLALVMNLKFYTNDTKRLKLKVRMFLGLTPTFVEVWKLQEKNWLGDYLPNSPSWIGLLGRIFLSYFMIL